jgi:hypothetical protein
VKTSLDNALYYRYCLGDRVRIVRRASSRGNDMEAGARGLAPRIRGKGIVVSETNGEILLIGRRGARILAWRAS